MGAILGINAAVMIGKQTTWGTPVSRTNSLRVTSLSTHTKQIDRQRRQHSIGPGLTHGGMPIAHVDGRILVDGLQIETPAHLNDATMQLIYAAMGSVSDGGSGPSSYTHTITLGRDLPMYTIEAIEGEDSAGDDSALVVDGAKCRELAWTIDVGAAVSTIRTTWVARTEGGDTTAGSPSFGDTDYPAMFYHVGDLSWNSITIDNAVIRSMTLTITNGLTADRFGFGSQLGLEPHLTGDRSVTLEITMERWQADALRAAYLSGAESNLTFTITNTHTAAFTLHNAQITGFSRDIQIDGITMQTVTFTAQAVPGGGNGLQVVFTNNIQLYTGG
jgi:hypothetical protein